MKSHRLLRVAEMIREVASETILFKMSDPRVKRVTVMRVEVSPDLQHAKVHVSVMGTAVEQATTLKGLNHAAGFVQAQLGDRMRTRYTPSLRFVLDLGVKQSVEISRLISEALGRSGTTSADSAGKMRTKTRTKIRTTTGTMTRTKQRERPATANPKVPRNIDPGITIKAQVETRPAIDSGWPQ